MYCFACCFIVCPGTPKGRWGGWGLGCTDLFYVLILAISLLLIRLGAWKENLSCFWTQPLVLDSIIGKYLIWSQYRLQRFPSNFILGTGSWIYGYNRTEQIGVYDVYIFIMLWGIGIGAFLKCAEHNIFDKYCFLFFQSLSYNALVQTHTIFCQDPCVWPLREAKLKIVAMIKTGHWWFTMQPHSLKAA